MNADTALFTPSKPKDLEIWKSIGVPSRGNDLYTAVKTGFDAAVYTRLAKEMDLDAKRLGQVLCISPSTILRRYKGGRFNTEESDKIARATEVLSAATELFEGDRAAALRWLRSPVKGLGNKPPLEMLGTSVETDAVLDLIGRLEHGVVA